MPNTKMHGERQSKPLENDHQKVCEALARIVELGSKCGAACIVGDKIYVSNNNIHSTSKDNNKARQKIITIMTFLGLQEKSQVQSGSTADIASGAAKAAIASSSSAQTTKSKESDGGKEQEDADSSEEEFPPYEDDADAIKISTEQQRSLVKEFLADKQHYKETEAYKKTYAGDKKYSLRKDLIRVMIYLGKNEIKSFVLVKHEDQKIHAEMRIAGFLLPILLANKTPSGHYVGTSKLCCPKCDIILDLLQFKHRGRHPLVSDNWSPPNFADSRVAIAEVMQTYHINKNDEGQLKTFRDSYLAAAKSFARGIHGAGEEHVHMGASPDTSDLSSEQELKSPSGVLIDALAERKLTVEELRLLSDIIVNQLPSSETSQVRKEICESLSNLLKEIGFEPQLQSGPPAAASTPKRGDAASTRKMAQSAVSSVASGAEKAADKANTEKSDKSSKTKKKEHKKRHGH